MSRLIVLLVLSVLLAISTASAHVTMYLDPQDSSVPNGYCNTTVVRVMANITGADDLWAGQIGIHHDQSCANITGFEWGANVNGWQSWYNCDSDCYGTDYDWIAFNCWQPYMNTVVELAKFTFHCNCSDCDYCKIPLNFSCGRLTCSVCPIEVLNISWAGGGNYNLYPEYTTLINGTIECGTPPPPSLFSKPLYEGWNLISLPLTPEDGNASANAVLSTVSNDAVYRYNASSKEFVPIGDTDVMNPGTGYFVNATANCTWTYSGYAYNSMNAPLQEGLNMVGWLNCSKDVDDALSSIPGAYYYVAQWDTQAQRFEVCNPAAPASFDDFTEMNRGTGYFISAKQGCAALSEGVS